MASCSVRYAQRLMILCLWPPAGDRATSATAAVGADQRALEDRDAWKEGAFPSYLQSEVDDFCASWSDALQVSRTPRCSCNLAPIHSMHCTVTACGFC
jgi:hypothetical protein